MSGSFYVLDADDLVRGAESPFVETAGKALRYVCTPRWKSRLS